jgi:hypothetical protein
MTLFIRSTPPRIGPLILPSTGRALDGSRRAAGRPRGEALGTERLLAFLAQRANDTAQQIADGLIQAAREHAGTESEGDDRTVGGSQGELTAQ